MKKMFLMAGIILLAASCSNESELTVSNEKETAPVKVRVSDFSMSMGDISPEGRTTRAAQDVADYNDVKAVTLAFYAGSTEVYKTTQIKTDGTTYTTFGEFSCNLPIGTYTMVAIGRGYWDGDEFTLTSPVSAGYTSERPRETFSATQSVTVTSTTPLDLSVTLNRVIAQLHVVSTDGRSAGVSKIKTTYSGGSKCFNPTTGFATDNDGFWQTNSPSTAVGSTINVYSNVFLTTDEQTMDITIDALDADDNVLFTKVVADVPLKLNRKTTLRGSIFTASASAAAFQLETEWLDGNTVNF